MNFFIDISVYIFKDNGHKWKVLFVTESGLMEDIFST